LEPLLRTSEAGRAVFISSGAAVRPRAFWGSYAATKAGLEALARSWADETDASPLRVAIVNPGPMRTSMRAEAFPGEDPLTLPHPDEIGPMIVEICADLALAAPTKTLNFADWRAARSGALSPTP
jgi:NAD(P)-dependent dehydrogenase (short-subunit alcohol dehydrogenase family)